MNLEEKEELISKIHPESPFSDRTIETIYLIESMPFIKRSTLNYLYNKIIKKILNPFTDLCKKSIQALPNNISSVVDIKNSNLSIHTEPDFSIENEFKILLQEYSYDFLILFNKDYFLCCLRSDRKLEENIRSIIPEIYSCLFNYPYPFHYHKLSELNTYELWAIPINDIFEKSSDDLIDLIVEAINYLFPLALMFVSENPLSAIEEHFKIWNPRYKIDKYVNKTGIDRDLLNNWIQTLQRKKQIIFQGSPGTGKTFIAENIARYLISGTDGFYETIQFHPAYTYEDFIQGIRPQTNNGQLEYNLVPGRFLEFCRKAESCRDNCILIIDEINRANLSQVFGELMYLLEYRDKEIALAGGESKFKIPSNVYLIGTMNTADRSIALVDFALRRRFAFIKVEPNYEVIRQFHRENQDIDVESLIAVLESINEAIEDRDYFIGVSYFLSDNLAEELENIWLWEIETYLEEYFYNSLDRIEEFRWENIKNEIRFYNSIDREEKLTWVKMKIRTENQDSNS